MWRSKFGFLLVGLAGLFSILTVTVFANTAVPKGFQANGNPQTDTPALLGQFGELIARERAYIETSRELVSQLRGSARFEVDVSMLDAALGEDFYTLYDEVLPRLKVLGQNSRRDQVALRFDSNIQKQLAEGEQVSGINDGAVNNMVAHYKIALEKLDISVRELLLAESHLMRRAADELAQGVDDSGSVVDYVSYGRASQLVSVPRQVKGFVQPRCKTESDAMKQSREIRNAAEDNFYFNQDMVFQSSVQAIYDAAELVEAQALLLDENGTHCK